LNKDVANAVEELTPADEAFLAETLAKHITYTGSTISATPQDFLKVVPTPYRKGLNIMATAEREGRDINNAIMEAVKQWLIHTEFKSLTAQPLRSARCPCA